jgi:hypothetical protein
VVDVPRLVRELLVSTVITYWVLSLVGEAFGSDARRWLLRISLPKLAALAALLLPIPPAGVLAFTSWESLTDSNHGIPFILSYVVYWFVLALGVYVFLLLARFMVKRGAASVSAS